MLQMYALFRMLALRESLRNFAWVGMCALTLAHPVGAVQTDIPGPAGSVAFGTSVTVLPNGNFVVTDPNGPPSGAGAVYLYSPGATLISTFTGSTANDHVGSGGVFIVGNGNFVVLSPDWHGGGAATWLNGNTGLNGTVSASNSLVDIGPSGGRVGIAPYVTRLTNGNYVVSSVIAGQATWGDGNSGIVGTVSSNISLIGTGERVTPLSNGNYVVSSQLWGNGVGNTNFGAATWCNGSTGTTGVVSGTNSLVGTTSGDYVGRSVTALSNGNYVVGSFWNNGVANSSYGAVTWGDGNSGVVGAVSSLNSLVGNTTGDEIGSSGVVALSNGNYVVSSMYWNNGVAGSHFGAATWADGSNAIVGSVSAANSLVGTTAGDYVSYGGVTALKNGNYVVASVYWNNGVPNSHFGAATWGNGSSGITGPVSAGNSLIGTTSGDFVGDVTALSNGNYVVGSRWNNGAAGSSFGAATWGNGGSGTTGTVSSGNSLFGTAANDGVGASILPLSNGNYVVVSSGWNNGVANSGFGAATWADGNGGSTGPVSATNSLFGITPLANTVLYHGVIALRNGNYVVNDPSWNNGAASGSYGAVTWGSGVGGTSGALSASRSLVGTTINDSVGNGGVTALSDGNYVVFSPTWNGGLGVVTFASGEFGARGTIEPGNNVFGTISGKGYSMVYDYDPTRLVLLVGRPASNIVTLLFTDQIFGAGFEP
jgi:hypothetical protein